jgi:MFS family permease
MSTKVVSQPKIFYGYWIVAATFLCLFITSGCGYFAFSLFVKSLQTDLGWGRGDITIAWTVYLLISGTTAPFVGRLISRYPARWIITAGAIIVGLGFSWLSLISQLWAFYLGYAIIGVGMSTMGHVPSSTIVSNWFQKRRGTAVGIMSAGIGAGGFALSPLIGGFLIPNFGWRTAYCAMAALPVVLVIPLAISVIKFRPADKGLYPDGEPAPTAADPTANQPSDTKGLTLTAAIATAAFWLIAISFLVGNFSQAGVLQTQVPHLADIGFPVALAAGALGAVGFGSTIGKFAFGWLCDQISPKYAWAIGLTLQAGSLLILMSIKPTTPLPVIWLYTILIGLSAGAWLPTLSLLVSTSFGLRAYGTIFGAASFFQSIGVATGPLMMGYMFDTMGDYRLAYIIVLALHAIALPTVLVVRRPRLT